MSKKLNYFDQVCEALAVELGLKLHMANRLDRDTSGVLLLLKRRGVYGSIAKLFEAHAARKEYVGLCRPLFTTEWKSKHTVVTGHGRGEFGAWCVYAAADIGRTLPHGATVSLTQKHPGPR